MKSQRCQAQARSTKKRCKKFSFSPFCVAHASKSEGIQIQEELEHESLLSNSKILVKKVPNPNKWIINLHHENHAWGTTYKGLIVKADYQVLYYDLKKSQELEKSNFKSDLFLRLKLAHPVAGLKLDQSQKAIVDAIRPDWIQLGSDKKRSAFDRGDTTFSVCQPDTKMCIEVKRSGDWSTTPNPKLVPLVNMMDKLWTKFLENQVNEAADKKQEHQITVIEKQVNLDNQAPIIYIDQNETGATGFEWAVVCSKGIVLESRDPLPLQQTRDGRFDWKKDMPVPGSSTTIRFQFRLVSKEKKENEQILFCCTRSWEPLHKDSVYELYIIRPNSSKTKASLQKREIQTKR